MPFNTMLRNLRIRKGLTQGELAKQTGLTRSAIGMYESGNREPKFEILELLADFFNVDMNFLLDKGIEDHIHLTPIEEIHIAKYRTLSDENRTDIDKQIDYKLYLQGQAE